MQAERGITRIVIPAFAGPLHNWRIMILLAGGLVGGRHAARGQAGEFRGSVGGGRRQPSAGGNRASDRLGGGGAAAAAGLRRADRAGVLSGTEPVQGGAAGGLVWAGRPGAGGGVGRPAVVSPLYRADAGRAGPGPLDVVALPRPAAAAGPGGGAVRGGEPAAGEEGAGGEGGHAGRCHPVPAAAAE